MTHRRLGHILGLAALAVYLCIAALVWLKIGRLPFAAQYPQMSWRGYTDADLAGFAQALPLTARSAYYALLLVLDPIFMTLFAGWVMATHWTGHRRLGMVLAFCVLLVDLFENMLIGLRLLFLLSPPMSIVQPVEFDSTQLALAAWFTVAKFPLYTLALIWTLSATFRKQDP